MDEIIEVREVRFGIRCLTRLWFSLKVEKEIADFRDAQGPNGPYWKKIKHYSQAGFKSYEGSGLPIRPEWGGVLRIGIHGSLFRIYGFYGPDGFKEDFIAIDALLKKGQKLNAAERGRINYVAKVKNEGLWRKVQNEFYPRIVE